MLFNSYPFIFIFLPFTLGIFLLLLRWDKKSWALGWLTLASLYFYSQWDAWNLPILLVSLLINYTFGHLIYVGYRHALSIGITLNLLLLGFFKYISFILTQFNITWNLTIALPLAISFFTFQQIAYLVDIKRKTITPFPLNQYILFVSFFPHLIAGPIMHYREMMPQFNQLKLTKNHCKLIGLGIVFFSIGLFKKVALADYFARISDSAFAKAAHSETLTALEAWQGTLAYTLQIYFDFSGYAEMAIGLGLFFGIWLPINFNSPYKATSIIDFWRRWHITLSNFLRDYLYIPLGGNRAGKAAQALNLLITMLLAGLWHGAGWTFILWGSLHGVWLILAHNIPYFIKPQFYILNIGVTFLGVMLLWVLFRAESWTAAINYYAALGNLNELLKEIHATDSYIPWASIIGGLLNVWILPNTLEWLHYKQWQQQPAAIRLNVWHGILAGIFLFTSLKLLAETPSNSFIYFIF